MDGAWNRLVELFLTTDSEFLFSVHSDIIYLPGTLARLMSWGKPLVGALHFSKNPPNIPMVYAGVDPNRPHWYNISFDETRAWLEKHQDLLSMSGPAMLEVAPADSLMPVDFTTTGCLLIHRDVLTTMTPPWFVYEYPHGSEDRRFFEAAKACGVQGYVDRSVIAGHGDPPVGAAHWLAWDALRQCVVQDKQSSGEITPA